MGLEPGAWVTHTPPISSQGCSLDWPRRGWAAVASVECCGQVSPQLTLTAENDLPKAAKPSGAPAMTGLEPKPLTPLHDPVLPLNAQLEDPTGENSILFLWSQLTGFSFWESGVQCLACCWRRAPHGSARHTGQQRAPCPWIM